VDGGRADSVRPAGCGWRDAARSDPIDQKARPSFDSAEEKTGRRKRGEAAEGKVHSGEAGSFTVRTGHARTFREKRADNRGRPGPRYPNLSPQKHSGEIG